MTTRRYGDDEVREIFRLATTGERRDQSFAADAVGLTLDDLQRIGQEAGIEPARVANAAEQLDARGRASPVQRVLGLPIGVSRIVDLPRAPTDREWEQLISHFRTTFGVQGHATTSGGLREWSHGSLHISVEPTDRGQQLRLGTRNEAALALNGLGIVLSGMSLFTTVAAVAAGKPEKGLVVFSAFGGAALVSFVANVVRAPGWARARAAELQSVAEHTVELLSRTHAYK